MSNDQLDARPTVSDLQPSSAQPPAPTAVPSSVPSPSISSIPMSARPQPEAGPSRSPRSVANPSIPAASPSAGGVGGNGALTNGMGAGPGSSGNGAGSVATSGPSVASPASVQPPTLASQQARLQSMLAVPGPGREAIMKQLEALSQSKAARERVQSAMTTGHSPSHPVLSIPSPSAPATRAMPPPDTPNPSAGSPNNAPAPAAPSPVPPTPITAPSPLSNPAITALAPAPTPSGSTPSPATPIPNGTPNPIKLPTLPQLPNGQIDATQLSAIASTLTPEQREYLLNMQKSRLAASQQAIQAKAQNAGVGPNGPGAPPGAAGSPLPSAQSRGTENGAKGQVAEEVHDQSGANTVSTTNETEARAVEIPEAKATTPTNGSAPGTLGAPAAGQATPADISTQPAPVADPSTTQPVSSTNASSASAGISSRPLASATPDPAPSVPSNAPAPAAPVPAPTTIPTPATNNPNPSMVRPPPLNLQLPPRPPPNAPNASTPIRPPARSIDEQRTQFLATYASYHKGKNLLPHPDVLNGRPAGVISFGDTGLTFELMELFLVFMRAQKPFDEENPSPPTLHHFLAQKGIPNPLPKAVLLPRPVGSTEPPRETTDTVEYLVTAFKVYLGGYDSHMAAMRHASMQQNQARAMAAAQAQRAAQGQQQAPRIAGSNSTGPTTSQPPQPSPQPSRPPPVRPAPPLSVNGASPSAQGSLPAHVQTQPHSATPSPPAGPVHSGKGRPPKPKPAKPTPINTQLVNNAAQAQPSPVIPPSAKSVAAPSTATTKKRKKGDDLNGDSISSHSPAPVPVPARPPSPKRPRFKVEYRPLSVPTASLGGWDERAVASTFPKHNLAQQSRSIHELQVVDMQAILMGLRSRMPRELGYAITVLSMLSLAYPEENFGGLPLAHIKEITEELLELLGEKALGDDGLEGWMREKRTIEDGKEDRRLLFSELSRLGCDRDYSFSRTDQQLETNPDIILSLMNLFRNFSLFTDNHAVLASNPDFVHLLVAISEPALCLDRGGSVYTVVDLARVQRDAVYILANIGALIDLRKCEPWAVRGIFRLLASFLVPAWELIQSANSKSSAIYGPPTPDRPAVVLSVARALEAFCKLSASDVNRQVLSRVPSKEVLELYTSLIKLLPVNPVQFRATQLFEEWLVFAEYAAHALYSLAFLATPSTRSDMRKVSGAVDVVGRIVRIGSLPLPRPPHIPPQAAPAPSPLAIIGRRLVEMLGVLNGTWTAGGDAVGPTGMGFGAGGVEGKGWTYKSQSVDSGWLAGKEEGLLGVLYAEGVDGVVWQELDGLIWGQ